MKTQVCYLDNAATSFPKPPNVAREIRRCIDYYCGNAGRGSHKLSLIAASSIYECREQICTLINVPAPENIVFVPSCTYGLNLIIKGLLKQGDHVLISDMEHNSVLRPLSALANDGKITFDIFSALSNPNKTEENILTEIEKKLRKNTKLLICNHQSNICSFSLPIDKIGELCKKYNVLFAVDVAQSIGHCNIDMQKMNIQYISAPGHKGLYGPQGSAFVAINSKNIIEPLIEGGNGIYSLDTKMPDFLPERHEVGTLPLPSIVGLYEGIKEIKLRGIDEISHHERDLFTYLCDNLLNINGISVYMPEFKGNTLSFNVKSIPAEQVCALLDQESICVRSGFHCSALGHTSLGTKETGTVRVSFGFFNTKKDIDKLLSVINKI